MTLNSGLLKSFLGGLIIFFFFLFLDTLNFLKSKNIQYFILLFVAFFYFFKFPLAHVICLDPDQFLSMFFTSNINSYLLSEALSMILYILSPLFFVLQSFHPLPKQNYLYFQFFTIFCKFLWHNYKFFLAITVR